MEETPKVQNDQPFIEVKNFYMKYGDKDVLKDINFVVKEKECLTILGESGVGKTTILRSIIGLVKPSAGEIFVEGKNVVDMEESELIDIRKTVSFAFQNGALFDSMTVYENVAFPLREHTDLNEDEIYKRVMFELEEFELTGTDQSYPSELSGGMKKRVGMARSMILKPKAILYDEPTVSLDPYNTAKLVSMMLKLKKRGTTSILVTHNMNVALKVSDRIALVLDGTIKAMGTPKSLEESYNVLLKNFIEGIKGGEQ